MLANDEVDVSLRPDYEAMQLEHRATETVLTHTAESTGGQVVFPEKDVDLDEAVNLLASTAGKARTFDTPSRAAS